MGMGEVDERTGKMQIFALSFVKLVCESSRKQSPQFKANKDRVNNILFLEVRTSLVNRGSPSQDSYETSTSSFDFGF